MRLLHVIGTFKVGGAEVFIRNLILQQKEEGINVELLILSNSNNFLVQEIQNKGISVHALYKGGKGYRNPFNIFILMTWLKKYDILHVHLVPEVYWVAIAKILSVSKVQTITTVHFPKGNLANNKFVHFVECNSFRFGYNFVAACSKDALNSLNEYSPKSNNICIPNGVDIKHFHEAKPYSKQERFGLNDNDYVITMVAAMKPPKKHNLLIEALVLLPKQVHVVFCGDGDNMDELKQLAKTKNVKERVHFLGTCNDVDRIVKTSDICALITNYEGLSLSSLEAMAAEKPFIGSRVNGMESLVNEAGVLVDNEPKSIADAIMRLMKDKDYYKQISKKCYERAKKYDIHIMARRYKAVYDIMITKRK